MLEGKYDPKTLDPTAQQLWEDEQVHAYDPASETGIVFVRTEIDLVKPDVVFRLHATGVHP